jgi:hypothetical protein
VSGHIHEHRLRSGTARRRGWPLLVLLAALIGLAIPPPPSARGTGQAFGTERPIADTTHGVGKALVRTQAARSKAAPAPVGTPPAPPPQAVAIIPRDIDASFVIADCLLPARSAGARAPAYRIAAQPRAPPANRA